MQRTSNGRAPKFENTNVTVESMLGQILRGKVLLKRRKYAKLFSQGEEADAIYFIHGPGSAYCCLAPRQEGGTSRNGSTRLLGRGMPCWKFLPDQHRNMFEAINGIPNREACHASGYSQVASVLRKLCGLAISSQCQHGRGSL